ncbi:MAG: chemotaxis response regulator protein-glutamate methylesterase [Leptolyngbya sp. Prado105]|jgi:two-component system response regulator WspF|nr:chemotaxis response regulator protein-glutamate methylesterase [Leptolyngbya sp. Prado105]
MRIAIVNDMVIAIEAIRRVLLSVADYQVVWVAKDGAEAISKCVQNTPDLILMDLFMPVMDGIEATRQIMQKSPCAVLIVTADIKQSAAKVFEAMSYGALDAVNTPILGSYGDPAMTQALLRKISTIEKLIRKSAHLTSIVPTVPTVFPTFSNAPHLVAIGASTGGPKALATILAPLPTHFDAAILIVQHIDAQFAEGLIDWLNDQTAIVVKKAEIGESPTQGTALVACTDDHLAMQVNRTLTYIKEPLYYPYRPSVNVLFKSLGQYWRTPGTAILLTGMGRDGAEGLSVLHQQGWYTIAQDQISSVVYGMPKAAIELQAAVEVWNPTEIARHLIKKHS